MSRARTAKVPVRLPKAVAARRARVATAREDVGGVGGPATPTAREHIVDSGLGWLVSMEK
jgi:hypothetical protein